MIRPPPWIKLGRLTLGVLAAVALSLGLGLATQAPVSARQSSAPMLQRVMHNAGGFIDQENGNGQGFGRGNGQGFGNDNGQDFGRDNRQGVGNDNDQGNGRGNGHSCDPDDRSGHQNGDDHNGHDYHGHQQEC